MPVKKSPTAALIEAMSALTVQVRALQATTEEIGSRAFHDSMDRGQVDRKMISELGENRLTNYRLLEAISSMTAGLAAMTAELSALRSQRAKGGNGHASDDDLTEPKTGSIHDSKPE